MRGLKIRNGARELVVHSEARGTACIGRASLVAVVQPSISGGANIAGYSRHTFASDLPIIWAIDLPVGRRVGIIDTGYANGVYTIGAYCGGNPNSLGFDQQFPVDIWAFSMINGASTGSTSGLRLRNSAGIITHDFMAPNITLPIAAGDLSIAAVVPPGIGRPVVIGSSPYYDVTYTDLEPGYIKTDRRQFALRTSDNVVAYSAGLMFRSGSSSGTPPADSTFTEKSPFFVVDGQFLP